MALLRSSLNDDSACRRCDADLTVKITSGTNAIFYACSLEETVYSSKENVLRIGFQSHDGQIDFVQIVV